MELDEVLSALGLANDPALARRMNLARSTVRWWRVKGIPAARRFQLARMIEAEGGVVPDGLLASSAVRKAA